MAGGVALLFDGTRTPTFPPVLHRRGYGHGASSSQRRWPTPRRERSRRLAVNGARHRASTPRTGRRPHPRPRDADLLREGVPSLQDRIAIRVIKDFVALTARRDQTHDETVLQG
jgi:hypothetical protein